MIDTGRGNESPSSFLSCFCLPFCGRCTLLSGFESLFTSTFSRSQLTGVPGPTGGKAIIIIYIIEFDMFIGIMKTENDRL
jgi:hypothetical protein